jgi:hypothetical protein
MENVPLQIQYRMRVMYAGAVAHLLIHVRQHLNQGKGKGVPVFN